MNKALLDTDISSEIIKAVDPVVTRNAIAYRKVHGVLTLSAITLMEVVPGFQRIQSLVLAQRDLEFLGGTETNGTGRTNM